MPQAPRIEAASDHSLMVTFGDEISEAMHLRVRSLFDALREGTLAGVVDLHPAYASVLVDFDPLQASMEDLKRELLGRMDTRTSPKESRLIEIPVRYGGESGPDLEAVASHCGMAPGEVIERHAGAQYRVHFLGFSPGFPYLGGMDPALATPRRPTPRKSVPAGSVGIAGSQAGIYPLDSPGGWQIIGRTPLRLFDARRTPPARLAMGDGVRFVPLMD